MAYIEERAEVAAPIGVVFDLISDYRRALTWMDGFTRFDLLSGPERGVGARVLAAGSVLGFTITTELEVVEFERPYRFVSRSTRPIRSETTWSLGESDHGTWIRYSGTYDLPLAMRFVGEGAITQVVTAQIRRSLENLQRLLEDAKQVPET